MIAFLTALPTPGNTMLFFRRPRAYLYGGGRALDLAGGLSSYRRLLTATGGGANLAAFNSDWAALGRDLRDAVDFVIHTPDGRILAEPGASKPAIHGARDDAGNG